jgi:tagaturonate reductase
MMLQQALIPENKRNCSITVLRLLTGAADKGLLIFPCELIFHNGTELKKTVHQYINLWNLGADFLNWFETACGVYSTLVDRIVSGFSS